MGRSLEIAWALMRIPRLFLVLFFWPLLGGMALLLGMATISGRELMYQNESPEAYLNRAVHTSDFEASWLTQLVHGGEIFRATPKVCRWTEINGLESPSGPRCNLADVDVVIQSASPETFDPKDYLPFFAGSVERVHICRRCSAAITLNVTESSSASMVNGLTGVGVYMLSVIQTDKLMAEVRAQASERMEAMLKRLGEVSLKVGALSAPIELSNAHSKMVLVFNIALSILVSFWLALRSHKKVLDYFAKNSVLPPLVAACGKKAIYNALWFITGARVAIFLLLSLPVLALLYFRSREYEVLLFDNDPLALLFWILTLLSSLGVVTLIASMADLKSRSLSISFLYRYLPLAISFVGAGLSLSYLFEQSAVSSFLYHGLAALPVIGLSAMLVAPIFPVGKLVFIVHTALALLLGGYILSRNSSWFGVHLEEL